MKTLRTLDVAIVFLKSLSTFYQRASRFEPQINSVATFNIYCKKLETTGDLFVIFLKFLLNHKKSSKRDVTVRMKEKTLQALVLANAFLNHYSRSVKKPVDS